MSRVGAIVLLLAVVLLGFSCSDDSLLTSPDFGQSDSLTQSEQLPLLDSYAEKISP